MRITLNNYRFFLPERLWDKFLEMLNYYTFRKEPYIIYYANNKIIPRIGDEAEGIESEVDDIPIIIKNLR